MTESVDQRPSFEELLQEFDDIVSSLESDDLSLDEAIDKYDQAAKLAARCSTILNDAELRIRQIDEALEDIESGR